MSGRHSWKRAPKSPTPPPGEGRRPRQPARPGREEPPPGRTAMSGKPPTVPNPPRVFLPRSSRIPSRAWPPPLPSPARPGANTPSPAPGLLSARRPLGGRPHLTSSRLRGQGRNNSARHPGPTRRPALCDRARPVHSAAARALRGRREQGGVSGELRGGGPPGRKRRGRGRAGEEEEEAVASRERARLGPSARRARS